MPGRGSYGPGGKWIHDRAHHIMEKGDVQSRYGEREGKSVAYAIATQQAHATGKSPKGFRTSEGVAKAKAKYDDPGHYKKKAAEMTRVNSASGRRILEKVASMTGRDNRTPFVGGTQMPTLDSKSVSNQIDTSSKSRAEMGPSPSFNALEKTQHSTIHDQAVKMPSSVGSLPKLGSDMRRIEEDPLVRYLKKHAEQLEVNLADVPCQGEDFELQSEPTDFRDTSAFKKKKEEDALLRNLFDNYPAEKAPID